MKRQLLPYTLILTATLAMFYYSRVHSISNNHVQLNQSRTAYSVFDQQVPQSVDTSSITQYRTTLDINAKQLNQSHQLTITGAAGLSGKLRLDGRVLTTLGTNGISINLAPYLSRGRHTITFVGTAQDTVQINFTGPRINLTHQASGINWIDLELTLEVW